MTNQRLTIALISLLAGLPLVARASLEVVPLPTLLESGDITSGPVPTGDTIGTLVGVYKEGHTFNLAEGLAINGGASTQTFPADDEEIGNNIFYTESEPILFSASSAPGSSANQHTITLEWRMQNGLDFVPLGADIEGEIAHVITFEFGMQNGLADGLGISQPFTFDHQELAPETHPGLYGAPFKLFNSQGQTILDGPFYAVSATAENEIEGRSGVQTIGGSVAGLDVVRAQVQFTITMVPEPSSVLSWSAGCLLISRRTRRQHNR
ncbi:MAG: hypothetical protein DHS20C16_05500 [Phycisphaerae bacterium]|nr:MAG: hypothetical protein DHS20C16_05500 [Phycisphaerae bacterium]